MPAFTYKTMLTPLTWSENNGITYGSGADVNRMAEFFDSQMPADPPALLCQREDCER